MEWLNLISSSFNWKEIDTKWWVDHAAIIGLFVFSFLQWTVIQVLLIHYYYFRRDLKRPRPDGIRLSIAERNISMHAEQLERLYSRLAELNRELDKAVDKNQTNSRSTRPSSQNLISPSYESTYTSLGEVALKKRLAEMKSTEVGNA